MFELLTDHHFPDHLKDKYPLIRFSPSSDDIIISNLASHTQITAPEINWYLANSQANEEIKLANLHRLYQNKLNIFDHAPFKEYTTQVQNDLLLLGTQSPIVQDFFNQATTEGFSPTLINPQEITHIKGEIGSFIAILQNGEELAFSQAVLFVQDENLCKFLGILSIQDYYSAQEVLEILKSRLGTYTYKTTTLYTPSLCQYHQRRPDKNGEGFCHKCVNVCPSFGVTKNDTLMELSFSQIDCMGCGGCIATCPTGALDFAPYTIDCLIESLRFYQDTQILLIPENYLSLLDEIQIPQHLSPLIIPREKFPSEAHLLAITQESGHSFIFFSPVISRPTKEAIKLVNDIYQAIFQTDAAYVAHDTATLQTLWDKPQKLIHYTYTPSPKEARRKHFAERLIYMIKEGDFGRVESGESGEMIRYGEIQIDEDKCTLCNSCVGACNVDSLIANSKNFSLQYNPSLCTTCGYCIPSCPENAISLHLNGIKLSPQYFTYTTMAQDSLFSCIECGNAFATSKSIQKIKTLMTPLFANDPIKLRTLECCADCKAKLMFER
ncbi:4Fe-4S dicluster domain-containing protein [Helicobacter kayseriensis]|uniref:4Fe-4S dicluster domain-containing protein n=1 Tax=Helicobacter kayseriensis TaxID=2905877 RepID=UPI001E495D0D|nr:4Fe-4S dicluster domain-containing protein [Helicobacter kayseriensis]MCE3047526.1 4Fe-4S binding protein [Helicobacter kayseriensis]MCE3048848.1 4Fe-4S binding protein [Helicobacter kayseriensis]